MTYPSAKASERRLFVQKLKRALFLPVGENDTTHAPAKVWVRILPAEILGVCLVPSPLPPAPSQGVSQRREFLSTALAATGAGALLLPGCQPPQGGTAANGSSGQGATGEKRLKAAFTNAGLKHTWCSRGRDTAMLWGDIMGIDVEWFDGESDLQKQRDKIEAVVDGEWDFCCFQAVQIDSLAGPVQKLKERGVPVISIDQYLVDKAKLRDVGVWCHVSADQELMGALSTQYIMDKIGGKGRVLHIGGLSAHSGAQGRARGFDRVVKNYPEVEVFGGGVRWCDWEKAKARDTFESLLDQSTDKPIVGAFFHNDDMALASVPALEGKTMHAGMFVGGVDGQDDGLNGVKQNKIACTAINPACRLHFLALAIGSFIVRNKETVDTVPLEIIAPTMRVTLEEGNVDAAFYQADAKRGLF